MGKSEKKIKKCKKNKHKHKKEHKLKVPKQKKERKSKRSESEAKDEDFGVPIALMNNKSHAPETPEEYQRRQAQIRREVDPVTGRTRLIKGDSEVLEEIVTRDRHLEVNKMATRGDGDYFEKHAYETVKKQFK